MPSDVGTEIIEALGDHLLTLSNIWPVAGINSQFDPAVDTDDHRYLKVQHAPNQTQTPYTGGDGFWNTGIYQVTVVTEKRIGELVASREAFRIINHFEYLTEITCPSGTIKINRRPSKGLGITTDQSYEVPVTINYELFTT